MPLQFWRSPGQGSKDTDPLLEAAFPPEIEDDYLKTDEEESDDDSDEDEDVKEARAERLRQTGGWLGYLKDLPSSCLMSYPNETSKYRYAYSSASSRSR
ncbi:hypothetical protein HBI24_171830 [Parastagonospora nodorum]|nr:hypothetical protein HBI52_144730 [Parastagonospora nodorum]KAH5577348.1 hypothetical protein HBI24_171830 [Parastagonospora nodorum]